ncbi:hypothetical protein BGZ70_004588 [Mortierella alpina]|uniref:Uncharacterized protein n=1 Tax=Mortierella alpina TaxID=64518 RepID=A0A9P6J9N4_MORAP|nr:hypothetical protein BGZ70_004588 [Mortierella alpina]
MSQPGQHSSSAGATAVGDRTYSQDLRRLSTSEGGDDDTAGAGISSAASESAGLHRLSSEHLAATPTHDSSSSLSPPGGPPTTTATSTRPQQAPEVAGDEEEEEEARKGRKRKSSNNKQRQPQTLLTKALLTYLNFFRIVQPLASLSVFGTITPVLTYFRTQTMFPTIQATLYVYTDTLACCSLLFSIMYLVDVLYRKPLFWPFTNRHFRQTSKARIGGDMIVCMLFCGLWFLALVGLVIDALFVDCGKLTGLEGVFLKNHQSVNKIKTICQLEKATLGLSVVCWACWMGVLLVLLYGHFWKRRQVIAERLRERLARRRPSRTGTGAAGVSTAIAVDGAAQTGSSSLSGRAASAGTGAGVGSGGQHTVEPSDCSCQNMEGEVGLTGIICNYDDDQSTIGHGTRRSDRPHTDTIA